MTPEEAREIDRLEFEADCRAAREKAYALIAERQTPSSPLEARPQRLPEEVLPKLPKVRRRTGPRPRHEFRGEALTVREWAERLGLSAAAISARLRRGMTFEQAITTRALKRGVPWQQQPGVGENFSDPMGTGGGRHAQDIPQIEIFPNDRTD